MGSPKRQKKKYSKPSHPWQKERILAEKDLLEKHGLRRKYEIWKMNSILKNFSNQAKRLITEQTSHAEIEKNQLVKKLNALGLLDKNAKIADVLTITLGDVMERRLQTLVHKKNLARSIRQARQFITHKHIMVGDRRMTIPSYLVPVEEENFIQFVPVSALSNPNHSERFIEEKKIKKGKGKKETKEPDEKSQEIKKESIEKKSEKEKVENENKTTKIKNEKELGEKENTDKEVKATEESIKAK